mmetsp:Transcript_67928/g.196659  ORF Transcript_67928/g.196659 Transcript_67928/m.196659 type:complete len:240 (-) Transcript_67928:917-1636(-)
MTLGFPCARWAKVSPKKARIRSFSVCIVELAICNVCMPNMNSGQCESKVSHIFITFALSPGCSRVSRPSVITPSSRFKCIAKSDSGFAAKLGRIKNNWAKKAASISDWPSRIAFTDSNSKSVQRAAAEMICSSRSSGSSERSSSMTSGATMDSNEPMASPSCKSEPKFSTGRMRKGCSWTLTQRSNNCSVDVAAKAWKSSPPCRSGEGSCMGSWSASFDRASIELSSSFSWAHFASRRF